MPPRDPQLIVHHETNNWNIMDHLLGLYVYICVCDRIYRKRIDSVGLLIVKAGGWFQPL